MSVLSILASVGKIQLLGNRTLILLTRCIFSIELSIGTRHGRGPYAPYTIFCEVVAKFEVSPLTKINTTNYRLQTTGPNVNYLRNLHCFVAVIVNSLLVLASRSCDQSESHSMETKARPNLRA